MRIMAISGKIGPAFGGTDVTAYGSAFSKGRTPADLDNIFAALDGNAREGMAWEFDEFLSAGGASTGTIAALMGY